MNKTLIWIIAAIIILAGGFFIFNTYHNPEQSENVYVYPTNENGANPYIHLFDWPPEVGVSTEPFTCTAAGIPTDRAGKTVVRMINGREYCVTKISEGAAGSVYTQYAYLTEIESKTIAITFSVRAVQCLNYDVPEQSVCQEKQRDFDVDRVVDTFVKETYF